MFHNECRLLHDSVMAKHSTKKHRSDRKTEQNAVISQGYGLMTAKTTVDSTHAWPQHRAKPRT